MQSQYSGNILCRIFLLTDIADFTVAGNFDLWLAIGNYKFFSLVPLPDETNTLQWF